jgi:hypothetical protein
MHSIFGTKHLIILAVTIAAIVCLYLLSRRVSFSKLTKVMLYVGIVSEIIKIFYYTIANEETHGGILPKTDLPFHLCSIQIIFLLILNVSTNEKLKRFLLSFMFPSCLIGGAAAILIATTSSLNGGWILTLQYFGYHAAIMIFALRIPASFEGRLTVKDYFSCLKFLLLLMFFAFYINSIVYDGASNINFMYVASPPQSGLPFLNEEHGWVVYIAHYAFLVLFCVSACYAAPIYRAIRARLGKQKKDNE